MSDFDERIIRHQSVCDNCKHCMNVEPEVYDYGADGYWFCMLGVPFEDWEYVSDEIIDSTGGGFYISEYCWGNLGEFSDRFKQIMKLENCSDFDESGRKVKNSDFCQFHERRGIR